ncbi:hypothetical protein MKX41_30760 [Paenibacillus sp. FSL R5-0475]|uniref:hypothetical protein n=1 Tax=Paenibacillus sp. FSL R5-0475 TaxID=2921643 RepID=UPI0030FC9E40
MPHWLDVYPHEVHASVILKNDKIKIWKVGERKLSGSYKIDDLKTRHPEYSYHEITWVVNNRDEHNAVFAKHARDWYRQWPHVDDLKGFHAYEVEEGDNQ